MGSIYRGMSGWIQEEEGAGVEKADEVQVASKDTRRVTSSECELVERQGGDDEEKNELKLEVSRLELDLLEVKAKYKKARGEKRELRRRLDSLASERQVIEVKGCGDGAAVGAVGSEGDLLEVGGSPAKGDLEKLQHANDEKAAEVEALVDRARQEARRSREENEELVEALRGAEKR